MPFRFKKIFRRGLHVLIGLLIFYLAMGLVMTTALAFLNYEGLLKKWLATADPHISLTYDKASISWRWGDPSLTLSGVKVVDPDMLNQPLYLQRVSVDFAIGSSILKRQLMTHRIYLSGLSLHLLQNQDGVFSLQDLKASSSKLDPSVIKWFLAQGGFYVDRTHFQVLLKDQQELNIQVDQASWTQGFFYQFKMKGSLAEVSNSQFNLQAEMNGEAHPFDFNEWHTNFKGEISGDHLNTLFNKKGLYGFTCLSGGGELQFSGEVKNAALQHIQVKMHLINFGLHNQKTNKSLKNQNINEAVEWNRLDPAGWVLHVSSVLAPAKAGLLDRLYREERDAFTGSALELKYTPAPAPFLWSVSAKKMDLALMGEWIHFWFPSKQSSGAPWSQVQVSGLLENLSVQLGERAGKAHFIAHAVRLGSNPLFPKGWPEVTYHGDVLWSQALNNPFWDIQIQNLSLINPYLKASLKGGLRIGTAKSHPTSLNLQAHFEGHNLETQREYYIPQAYVPKELSDWLLQGLVKVPHLQGDLIWRGNLEDMPYVKKPGLFQIKVKVDQGSISPWKDWPLIQNINANLLFHNQIFTIDGQAETLGTPLQSIHFEISDLRPRYIKEISISGQAHPTLAQGLSYLAAMPIVDQKMRQRLHDLSASSNVKLNLRLTIPLQGRDTLLAKGSVLFNHNSLASTQENRKVSLLDNLEGKLYFSNDIISSGPLTFKAWDQPIQAKILPSPLSDLNIILKHFLVFSQDMGPLSVQVKAEDKQTLIHLSAPLILGTLVLREGPEPLIINLETLHILNMPSGPRVLLGTLLSALPPLHVHIVHLFYKEQDLGGLYWTSHPLVKGIKIDKIVLDSPAMGIVGSARVQTIKNKWDKIKVRGQFLGRDYGEFLTEIGYPGVLLQGAGPINFKLAWVASSEIDYSSLNGNIQLDLKNGKILQVNSGVLRAFGIFSLDTVMSALSFNFNKIVSTGLNYDLLKGEYVLENGIARTHNFEIEGPALNMQAQGEVNLEASTLDQHVTVVPKVGTSLAVAAGFLGGPVVGVATWAANQFLTTTVLKNKGITLHVTGNIAHPKTSMIK